MTGRTVIKALAMLAVAVAVAGGGLPGRAFAEDPEPTITIGGQVETADFAVTIPQDWLAFEPQDDGAEVDLLAIGSLVEALDWCDGAECAALLDTWLRGVGETSLALLGPPLDPRESLDQGATQCTIDGPESASGRTASELASIAYDFYDRSDRAEVVAAPRSRQVGALMLASFDFALPTNDLEGVVHIYGDGERFFRLTCQGHGRPADSWRSIADTFEPRPLPDPADVLAAAARSGGSRTGVPELQDMLPLWVGGRGLATHSHRGLDYLRDWSRMPDELVADLEEDPAALDRFLGVDIEVDDLELAVASRSSPSDPAHLVTALRVKGLPASELPLSMVVADADAAGWAERTFGTRTVLVASGSGADPSTGREGRHYVYDVGDVRFTVASDDEAWAAEAIARLRPDPVIEDTSRFVDLPEDWRSGYSPTVGESTVAEAYADGVRLAAHDASRLGERYIPTLEGFYSGVRLDENVSTSLDRWAAAYSDEQAHGRTITSVERLALPSGEALRLQQQGSPPGAGFDVAEVRYLIAAPAGVFDLLFSVEAGDLDDYEAVFEQVAESLLAEEPDPEGPLARLARGETSRTELELRLGGHTVAAPREGRAVPESSGPVVVGGRLEAPAAGVALEVPEGWYAIDVAHPEVVGEMQTFDPMTRSLLAGRLRPENPLLRGNFPVTIEATHLTGLAIDDVVAGDASSPFVLIALPLADGVGAHHECVVYRWEAEAETSGEEAALTLPTVQQSDPTAALTTLELPAGDAARISASNGSWQFAIYTVVREGLAWHLECGHDERHDELWEEMARSLELP